MSCIKSQDTAPEIELRKLLAKKRIRGFKPHYNLPGRPDLVFVKKKVAIFIDGCFWHKCPKCFIKPATRTEFWLEKIQGNIKRDKLINSRIKKQDWKVLRFWEHEIEKDPEKVVSKIIKVLKSAD